MKITFARPTIKPTRLRDRFRPTVQGSVLALYFRFGLNPPFDRSRDRVLSLYLGYGQNPPFDKLRDQVQASGSVTGFFHFISATAQGPGSCTISRLLIAYLPFDRLRDRFRPAAQGPGSCTLSRLRPEPALRQAQGPGSGQRLRDRVQADDSGAGSFTIIQLLIVYCIP